MTCMARDTSWQSAKTGTSGTSETNGTSFCVGECPHAGDWECSYAGEWDLFLCEGVSPRG